MLLQNLPYLPYDSVSYDHLDDEDAKRIVWEDELDDDSSEWETVCSDDEEADLYDDGFDFGSYDETEDELYRAYYGGDEPELQPFDASTPEVLHFTAEDQVDGSESFLTIETWQVADAASSPPHPVTPFMHGFATPPQHSVIEILEYHDGEMYELCGLEDDLRLCVYKDRVYRAERPLRDCEDALFAVRPRSAKDRRRNCWRRLKEV